MAQTNVDGLERLVAQIYTSDVGAKPVGIDAAQAYLAGSSVLQWGGDVSDIFTIGDGTTTLLVADVSGKGLEAAIQTSAIKYAIRAYASLGFGPARRLEAFNTLYAETCRFEGRESFASVFVASVAPDRRSLSYASGGHDPALLIRADGELVELKTAGPVVGVVEAEHLFEERSIDLRPYDSIVSFTDGVPESRTPGGSMLGFDGAAELVRANAAKSAYAQAHDLLETVRARCAARHCDDDIAILCLRILEDGAPGSSLLV